MGKTYEPELGQMAFGANYHEIPLSGYVRAGLFQLGEAVTSESDTGANPTENSGAQFENPVFALRAFCWCDNEQEGHQEGCPPNFEFFGGQFRLPGSDEPVAVNPLVVDWYKYLGRGSSQSRTVSSREWDRIVQICLASIPGSSVGKARRDLEAALAPLSPWPFSVAISPIQASLFFSLALPENLEPSIDQLDVAGVEALVQATEVAIAAAVAPLGWGPPGLSDRDEPYWLAVPFPPDFDDSAEARAVWRDLSAEELAAYRDQNGSDPVFDERWTLIRHTAINLRRNLLRLDGSALI